MSSNKKYTKKPNYDFDPILSIGDDFGLLSTKDEFIDNINQIINNKPKIVIAIDAYLGIDYSEYLTQINADAIIDLIDYRIADDELEIKFRHCLTKHPVNGYFAPYEISEFYSNDTYSIIDDLISKNSKVAVIGIGALQFCKPDLSIYLNQTFDSSFNVLLDSNEYLTEKRLKYIDFYIVNKYKREQLKKVDFIVNSNKKEETVVDRFTYQMIVKNILTQPFRTTPLLQENIWGGGLWFQERLGLEKNDKKYSFLVSAILEEQSVKVKYKNRVINIPGLDIIGFEPISFLGAKIFYSYGYRTRTHLLLVDTMGGENSSIQVHPTAWYNQDYMNYPFGHHEGYYIVETNNNSGVYLGYKSSFKLQEIFNKFRTGLKNVSELKKYIDFYQVSKFDYFYLPGGAIHAFGSETVCLEIDSSSTTTFKLWDWNRKGSQEKPRYLDVDLGEKVSQELYNDKYSRENLYSPEKRDLLRENKELKIGTMDHCPMNVEKYLIDDTRYLKINEQVTLLALVSGEEAEICSLDNTFKSFTIHYMEVVYISATISNLQIKTLKGEIEILKIEKDV